MSRFILSYKANVCSEDDPYSLDQLRDPRMNLSVIRPLVDKFYEAKDVSMGALSFQIISSCYIDFLLANGSCFLHMFGV